MNGETFTDETTERGTLSFVDRSAPAYFTMAQTLMNALPAWDSLPLLPEGEHAILVDRIRGHAHDLRELAGERGAQLWAAMQ
jgi:hypothetical protein